MTTNTDSNRQIGFVTGLTCGDCKLILDCSIREMSTPACHRIELWEENNEKSK